MTDAESAFIKSIRAAPDDDTPRLIFADWLDEHGQSERADFIRTQCETARVKLGDPRWEEFCERELPLLGKQKRDFVRPLARICKEWSHQSFVHTEKWKFHRGFVRDIVLRGATFLKHANRIFEIAPLIQGVALYPFDGDPDELAVCPALRRLRELNIYESFHDHALRSLVSSPNLGTLRCLLLHANGLGSAGIRDLVSSELMPRLEALDLWANKLDQAAIEILVGGTHVQKLKWLGLGWTWMGLAGLKAIASSSHMPNLRSLNINAGSVVQGDVSFPRNPVGVEGCRILANATAFDGLRALHMEDHQIGDAGIGLIACSPHLRGLSRLHFRYNSITSNGVDVLTGNSSLLNPVALDLSNNPIGPMGAKALAISPRMARLESIDLDYADVRDEGLEAIAASPYLRTLTAMWIAGNGITDRGVRILAASSNLTNLSTLVLYGNPITGDGVIALADPQNLPNLRRLALSGEFDSKLRRKLRKRFGATSVSQSEYARWKTFSHPSSMATRPSMGGIGICM